MMKNWMTSKKFALWKITAIHSHFYNYKEKEKIYEFFQFL